MTRIDGDGIYIVEVKDGFYLHKKRGDGTSAATLLWLPTEDACYRLLTTAEDA